MLINGHEGVLSIGGTAAKAVDMVVQRTKDTLDALDPAKAKMSDETPLQKRGLRKSKAAEEKGASTRDPVWDDGWRWSKVQGAEGWWQILMQGVWVDGSKVLKNQPVVVDVSFPPSPSLIPPHLISPMPLNHTLKPKP